MQRENKCNNPEPHSHLVQGITFECEKGVKENKKIGYMDCGFIKIPVYMKRENKCNCSAEYPHDQFAHNGHTANFVQRENKWQDRVKTIFVDNQVYQNIDCIQDLCNLIQSEIDTAIAEERERNIQVIEKFRLKIDEQNPITYWKQTVNNLVDNIINLIKQ